MLVGVILCLGLYAVLWQKILATVPLGVAYLSKSLTIVLVLLCSSLVFGEIITLNNILGTGLILLGLINLYAPRR
jgi:drug/metabolite transporter (DMT)-like permease